MSYIKARLLLAVFLALPFPLTAQTAGSASCPVYVLKKAGMTVAIDLVSLPPGGVRVFPVGPTSPNLDVVLPVAPGESGNLIRSADSHFLVARAARETRSASRCAKPTARRGSCLPSRRPIWPPATSG